MKYKSLVDEINRFDVNLKVSLITYFSNNVFLKTTQNSINTIVFRIDFILKIAN